MKMDKLPTGIATLEIMRTPDNVDGCGYLYVDKTEGGYSPDGDGGNENVYRTTGARPASRHSSSIYFGKNSIPGQRGKKIILVGSTSATRNATYTTKRSLSNENH